VQGVETKAIVDYIHCYQKVVFSLIINMFWQIRVKR